MIKNFLWIGNVGFLLRHFLQQVFIIRCFIKTFQKNISLSQNPNLELGFFLFVYATREESFATLNN